MLTWCPTCKRVRAGDGTWVEVKHPRHCESVRLVRCEDCERKASEKIDDTEFRECDRCGKVRKYCFQVSPYDHDVNNIDEDDERYAVWMCDDCVSDSAMEI